MAAGLISYDMMDRLDQLIALKTKLELKGEGYQRKASIEKIQGQCCHYRYLTASMNNEMSACAKQQRKMGRRQSEPFFRIDPHQPFVTTLA